MKNQKLVIISIVLAILFIAILGTVVILKDDVSAVSSCNHTWGEWENLGIGVHIHECTKCGASEGQDCDDYSTWVSRDENYHWWTCSVCGSITMPREHEFVNGVCKDCGEAEPGCSHTSWDLKWNSNYHWNECTSCGEELYGKETHRYVSGECVTCGYDCTHPSYSGGTCTKCGEAKPGCSHASWDLKWNSNYHWNECKSCGEELYGKETHRYVSGECVTCGYDCTHPSYSGGTCTKCGETEPGCSHTSWNLTWDSNYHWNECTSCGEELFGKETHKYVNGTCTICTYKCSHGELVWQNSETEHWQICKNCQGEVTGTRSKHTYNTGNGTCTTCTYKCEHKDLVWQNSETEHWQICKNCSSEIKNTRVAHSVKEWKDQGNGTHTGACETCEKQLQENHNYVDNKCKCGAIEKEETVECKHTEQKWLAISTEHWKVCKNCEVEISGTRESHTFENGVCKECNYKCKHKNIVYKSNETEHWQECENCLDEIDGTRETHSYENGKCTDCTNEQKVDDENTQKPTDDNQNNTDNKNEDTGNKDTNQNEDTDNKDNVNQDENQTNKDNTTQKDNVSDNKQDTTQKTDKIPDTGIKENMQIAIMITAAVIGCALLINLSREE